MILVKFCYKNNLVVHAMMCQNFKGIGKGTFILIMGHDQWKILL